MAKQQWVGWREWVRFPKLGINSLVCKVDTGARSSALHAYDIEEFYKDNALWVRFAVHTEHHQQHLIEQCEAKVLEKKQVTNSGGMTSERYFIKTTLEIGDLSAKIAVSLTTRDKMKYQMLLGRTALRKLDLLVDVKDSYLQGGKTPQRKAHETRNTL